MPDADPITRRFELRPDVPRQQRRILYVALAWYLPGAAALTAAAAWSATRPADALASALITVSAVQAGFFTYVVVAQLWLNGRDLRRAGTPDGVLVLDADGMRAGQRLIRWPDVERVRVRRRGVPHLAVTERRRGMRRRRLAVRGGYYGLCLDELSAVFERYAPVDDEGRPRRPASDAEAGTITFFFNDWILRAQRGRHRRNLWRLPLMLSPASAGFALLPGGLAAAALVFAVLAGLLLSQQAKAARVSRLLRIGRAGMGRLLLTPEHLKLAGTDVPIPWSHVQDAAIARDARPGLNATVRCPGPDTDTSPRCPFRDRTIAVHIAESLYYTTSDDIGAAFGRFTRVES
jgi:hypothetical protein